MFRKFPRGRNLPLERPPSAPGSSLHEAKLAAWSIAVGESRPSTDPSYRMHRHHRGMLDDLPLPETPEREPLLSLRSIVETIAQAIGLGGSPSAGAAQLSGAAKATGGKTAEVTYIDRNVVSESCPQADAAELQDRSRAA